jgi:hypothetical protein
VLSIAQIIKFVMPSAAESKLAALFITAHEMIPHRQTLIDMGWPQLKNPIQTDNSTAPGVTNNTIVPRWSKIWMCNFGGSVAKNPKTSFVTIGMRAPKTGLITILNTILTPTMKPIAAPMRASGTRLTHDCVPTSPNHWSLGFPSRVFS